MFLIFLLIIVSYTKKCHWSTHYILPLILTSPCLIFFSKLLSICKFLLASLFFLIILHFLFFLFCYLKISMHVSFFIWDIYIFLLFSPHMFAIFYSSFFKQIIYLLYHFSNVLLFLFLYINQSLPLFSCSCAMPF